MLTAKYLDKEEKACKSRKTTPGTTCESANTAFGLAGERQTENVGGRGGISGKDFRKALRKGYTPKELSAILKNEGIIIPAYLVEKFLKPENGNPRPKPAPNSASKKKAETPPVAGQFTITPDTALEDL